MGSRNVTPPMLENAGAHSAKADVGSHDYSRGGTAWWVSVSSLTLVNSLENKLQKGGNHGRILQVFDQQKKQHLLGCGSLFG